MPSLSPGQKLVIFSHRLFFSIGSCKNDQRQGYSSGDPSILAYPTLVHHNVAFGKRPPNSPPSSSPYFTSMESGPAPPKLRSNEAYFCYVIRQCFSTQNLGQQATSDFISSFMKGTMSSYRGVYKEWLAFAFKNSFDPLQPLAPHPMTYLA